MELLLIGLLPHSCTRMLDWVTVVVRFELGLSVKFKSRVTARARVEFRVRVRAVRAKSRIEFRITVGLESNLGLRLSCQS